VSAGLSFERVSTGESHACAETTANRAYCWGIIGAGALGDGTFAGDVYYRLTRVAVLGGLFFNQVSAGGDHSCAKYTVVVNLTKC
jgi:hypothetical protein